MFGFEMLKITENLSNYYFQMPSVGLKVEREYGEISSRKNICKHFGRTF